MATTKELLNDILFGTPEKAKSATEELVKSGRVFEPHQYVDGLVKTALSRKGFKKATEMQAASVKESLLRSLEELSVFASTGQKKSFHEISANTRLVLSSRIFVKTYDLKSVR